MDADADRAVSTIAAAIGEPARARMLHCLVDGRARTSIELAAVAGVGASTASSHLARLRASGLVRAVAQGKHRYYSLNGALVADALEALQVLAGGARAVAEPSTPSRLRQARTCYDHLAGSVGVALHDRILALRWLRAAPSRGHDYDITTTGAAGFATMGIDLDAARALRRRFAFACLDWSERRPHVGGALGAALLSLALRRRWLSRDLDSRALNITAAGRRELAARFGVRVDDGRL